MWDCLPHSPASPAAGLRKYLLSEHDQSTSSEVGPKLLKFSLEYKYQTGILLVLLPGLGYSVFYVFIVYCLFSLLIFILKLKTKTNQTQPNTHTPMHPPPPFSFARVKKAAQLERQHLIHSSMGWWDSTPAHFLHLHKGSD